MATYQYFGDGYSLPYDAPGTIILRRRLNVPDLIANARLALTTALSTPVKLAATGFAQNDILNIFLVPKGTLVRRVNLRIVTPEGGTATVDIGITGVDADGFMAGGNVNSSAGTVLYTPDTVAYGTDNALGYFCAANQAIGITFNNAVDALVADVWAEAAFVADLDAY